MRGRHRVRRPQLSTWVIRHRLNQNIIFRSTVYDVGHSSAATKLSSKAPQQPVMLTMLIISIRVYDDVFVDTAVHTHVLVYDCICLGSCVAEITSVTYRSSDQPYFLGSNMNHQSTVYRPNCQQNCNGPISSLHSTSAIYIVAEDIFSVGRRHE